MTYYKPKPEGGGIMDAEENEAVFEDMPGGLPALHSDGRWRRVRVIEERDA